MKTWCSPHKLRISCPSGCSSNQRRAWWTCSERVVPFSQTVFSTSQHTLLNTNHPLITTFWPGSKHLSEAEHVCTARHTRTPYTENYYPGTRLRVGNSRRPTTKHEMFANIFGNILHFSIYLIIERFSNSYFCILIFSTRHRKFQ